MKVVKYHYISTLITHEIKCINILIMECQDNCVGP